MLLAFGFVVILFSIFVLYLMHYLHMLNSVSTFLFTIFYLHPSFSYHCTFLSVPSLFYPYLTRVPLLFLLLLFDYFSLTRDSKNTPRGKLVFVVVVVVIFLLIPVFLFLILALFDVPDLVDFHVLVGVTFLVSVPVFWRSYSCWHFYSCWHSYSFLFHI